MTYYFFGRQRGELTGISVCCTTLWLESWSLGGGDGGGGSRIRCEVWQLVSVGRVNVAGSELNSETFKYVAAWIEVAVWYEPFRMSAEMWCYGSPKSLIQKPLAKSQLRVVQTRCAATTRAPASRPAEFCLTYLQWGLIICNNENRLDNLYCLNNENL